MLLIGGGTSCFAITGAQAVTVDAYLTHAIFKEIEIADNWSSPNISYIKVISPGRASPSHVPNRIDKKEIVQLVFDTYRVRFIDGVAEPAEAITVIKEHTNTQVGAVVALAGVGLCIWQAEERKEDREAAHEATNLGLRTLESELNHKAKMHNLGIAAGGLLALWGLVMVSQTEEVKVTPEGYRLANAFVDPIKQRVGIAVRF